MNFAFNFEEFDDYRIMLENNIYWQSRDQYLQILESFLNRNISGEEFCDQFADIRSKNMEALDILEANLENEMNLKLNPKSRVFSDIIASIDTVRDFFDSDIEDSNSSFYGYGISENHLRFYRFYLNDTFFSRIREYCKES